MYQVTGEYPDYKAHSMKSGFHLNADQSFNHSTWGPPIHWKGYVGGHEVKFTQVRNHSFSISDIDWQDFPKELESAKTYIVEAIDKAMKVMD